MPTNTKMNKQLQDKRDTRKIIVLSAVAAVLLIAVIGLGAVTLPLMFAGPGATPVPTPSSVVATPVPTTTPQGSNEQELAQIQTIMLTSDRFDPQSGPLEFYYVISSSARTEVAVVDMSGNAMRTLWQTAQVDAGQHDITWDGVAQDGALIAAGEYLIRVQAFDGENRLLDVMTAKIEVVYGATPTPEPTQTPQPTQTPEPTATPTPSPSPSATPEPTPSATPEPTLAPEPTPEQTLAPEPTPEPTPQPTPDATLPPENTPEPTPVGDDAVG